MLNARPMSDIPSNAKIGRRRSIQLDGPFHDCSQLKMVLARNGTFKIELEGATLSTGAQCVGHIGDVVMFARADIVQM